MKCPLCEQYFSKEDFEFTNNQTKEFENIKSKCKSFRKKQEKKKINLPEFFDLKPRDLKPRFSCFCCNKRIFFFNKFKREYGLGTVYNKKTMKPLGHITLCSKDCYEKILNIFNSEEYDKQLDLPEKEVEKLKGDKK